MTESSKAILAKIVKDAEDMQAEGERLLDAPPTGAPATEEEARQGKRLLWICAVAVAHANGCTPWRADYPSEEDLAWATEVGEAVLQKRARPPHPDPEIEQLLSDALPT
ncbi:hypothetical protein [Ralstonia pseudosolanacearum]|uniref:hypothetical protein n=1 Tax=Ralstonia pseudosolanacearum TaxID=1310165 RepID=UPI003CF94724